MLNSVLALVLSVHFSPHGGCTEAVVSLIREAKVSVHVAAYAFTSKPIADALIAQQRSGAEVVVVVDRHYAKTALVTALRSAGVRVWSDSTHAIMHDKFIVVDSRVTETGSFNFTAAAEKSNAENCLVVRDVPLAMAYQDNWSLHRHHSVQL